MRRSSNPLQRKPMRQGGGAKGEATRAKWRERRDQHLAASPDCQHRGTDELPPLPLDAKACWGRITVHHRLPRGAGGTASDTSPLVTLCAAHHDYIEQHRAWAKETLWLLGRVW